MAFWRKKFCFPNLWQWETVELYGETFLRKNCGTLLCKWRPDAKKKLFPKFVTVGNRRKKKETRLKSGNAIFIYHFKLTCLYLWPLQSLPDSECVDFFSSCDTRRFRQSFFCLTKGRRNRYQCWVCLSRQHYGESSPRHLGALKKEENVQLGVQEADLLKKSLSLLLRRKPQ